MKDTFMQLADDEAKKNMKKNFKDGGPFGAIIVKNNKVIAKAHNSVLKTNDPTAHAEINVIRKACRKLKTYDLKGCILYTSCYPCPMCFSAIIWSNIKEIYYGNTKEDAADIGFRDDFIYNLIKNNNNKDLIIKQINHDLTIKTFKQFDKKQVY